MKNTAKHSAKKHLKIKTGIQAGQGTPEDMTQWLAQYWCSQDPIAYADMCELANKI